MTDGRAIAKSSSKIGTPGPYRAIRLHCHRMRWVVVLSPRFPAVAEAAAYPIMIKGLNEAQAGIWKAIGDGDHEGALRLLRGVSGSLRALLVTK